MKKVYLCAFLLLAGCAKQPGDIVAASVPTDPFMRANCPDLAAQKAGKHQQLDSLSSDQADVAHSDAVWMTMIHVPVASMTQGDYADAIARLKGEINAINQVSQAKGCTT